MELMGLMEVKVFVRLLLIYMHLMLSVFALRDVLINDLKVLRRTIRLDDLASVHKRIVWLLSALWMTGLALVAIDTGFDPEQLADKPKILAKLFTVSVLTVNGLLLQYWCFPRIEHIEKLGVIETVLVMASGATSTASWLMAPFLGVAKPLAKTPVHLLIGMYGIEIMIAVTAAIVLGTWWRWRFKLASPNALRER